MKKRFLERGKKQADLIEKRVNSEMSTGERLIHDYLNSIRIEFKREHFFLDCINPKTGKLLFFDFYIPAHKIAIEYDGVQHYKAVDGRDKLEDLKARDKVKNKYCNKNGIYMLRVRNHMLKSLASFIEDAICRKGFKPPKKKKIQIGHRIRKAKPKKIKGRHPEKQMNRLKTKIQKNNEELERRRNEARLKYPSDIRIHLAEKYHETII